MVSFWKELPRPLVGLQIELHQPGFDLRAAVFPSSMSRRPAAEIELNQPEIFLRARIYATIHETNAFLDRYLKSSQI